MQTKQTVARALASRKANTLMRTESGRKRAGESERYDLYRSQLCRDDAAA